MPLKIAAVLWVVNLPFPGRNPEGQVLLSLAKTAVCAQE